MKKTLANEIVGQYDTSITRACRVLSLHRSMFYYAEKRNDEEVISAIRTEMEFGDGFWKIFMRLRNKGFPWNHKKVYRVYKKLNYNKPRRLKKRLPARVKEPLVTPETPNHTWSIDFVSDSLDCGRKFRVLNILDDFNREAVAQEISMSMPAKRVITLLEKAIWMKGKPLNIRCDNGPEFISNDFKLWCKANDINIKYIQPGAPTQNSYVERFNGSYRRAVLDAYIFKTIEQAREITNKWMEDYNNIRPHDALNNLSPVKYKQFMESTNK
jgi:putative transposase